MGALGVAQKIQIMGSLLVDKLSIAVHGFEQSSRYCSATPPNWRNDLSWSSIWVSHGECTSVCDAYWTGPMVNYI